MPRHTLWTNPDEDSFILDNVHLDWNELHAAYCKKFGAHRSRESINGRRRRLLSQHGIKAKKALSLNPLASRTDKIGTDTDWLLDTLAAAKNRRLPKAKKKKGTPGSALVIHLSDLHFGKKTPHYDMATGAERLLSIPGALPVDKSIDKIYVVLTGDLVDGEMVYKTQQVRLEAPAIRQAQTAVTALWDMLVLLRKTYRLPVEVYAVHGNHGKTHRFAHETSNWDNVVCLILHLLADMHKDKDLVVHYTPDQFVTFDIKDKRVLITHEGAKHGGTPAMKIKSAGWRELFQYDILMQGHHHAWQITEWHGRLRMVSGSLCGEDDYSTKLALGGPPRQGYFTVTPGHQVHSIGFFEW